MKAKPGELAALREEVFARDQGCQWLGCREEIHEENPWELVHLHHRGMGGSIEANTPKNCIILCRFHHSIYDGRIVGVTARSEWASLFQHLAGIL